MKLTIIIPCYNEKRDILSVLKEVLIDLFYFLHDGRKFELNL